MAHPRLGHQLAAAAGGGVWHPGRGDAGTRGHGAFFTELYPSFTAPHPINLFAQLAANTAMPPSPVALPVAQAQRQRWPISVFMLDLGHFKAVNDDHGHEGGDRALQLFADVLRDCLRDNDPGRRPGAL